MQYSGSEKIRGATNQITCQKVSLLPIVQVYSVTLTSLVCSKMFIAQCGKYLFFKTFWYFFKDFFRFVDVQLPALSKTTNEIEFSFHSQNEEWNA